MNPKDQKKITKNLIKIRKAIAKDVNTIAERLVEEGVFSQTALSEICNVRPSMPHLQCGMLINNLMRAGPEAFTKFRKVLEKLGYTSLVDDLENSCSKDEDGDVTLKTNDRERTFIIPSPRVPNTNSTVMSKSFTEESQKSMDTADVEHIERMMTVVLQSFDEKDRNSNKLDYKKGFRERLAEESKESDELVGFFKTLRYQSLPISSH